VLFEDVCFDAQQAVEKALKALLVLRGVQVPRTHAISELTTMLADLGFDIPADVQEASALTDYAVTARYPGPSEPVLVEDYEKAVAIAWPSSRGQVASSPRRPRPEFRTSLSQLLTHFHRCGRITTNVFNQLRVRR
jgi:hypothetical protein